MRLTEPTEVNSFGGKAARFLGYSAMGIRRGDFTGGRSWRREGYWDRTFSGPKPLKLNETLHRRIG